MRGLSLIEVLVYLALFSMLMTGVIASMFHLRSSSDRIEALARLTDEGHFILERYRKDAESPTLPTGIALHEWSVVTESESVEVSFTLSTLTAAGNPVSLPFYGTFFPPFEP